MRFIRSQYLTETENLLLSNLVLFVVPPIYLAAVGALLYWVLEWRPEELLLDQGALTMSFVVLVAYASAGAIAGIIGIPVSRIQELGMHMTRLGRPLGSAGSFVKASPQGDGRGVIRGRPRAFSERAAGAGGATRRRPQPNALDIGLRGGLTDEVTPHAGSALLIELGRRSGVMAAADKYLPARKSRTGLGQGQMVEAFVLLSALGGDCIDDFDALRRDRGLAAPLGYDVPASVHIHRKTLHGFISEHVADETEAIYTDEWAAYRGIGDEDTVHETVNHSADEWVRGLVHTNTAESVNSLLKRSIVGSYHHLSTKHLPAYLDEIEWRFNNRENPYIFRETLRVLVTADPMTYQDLID